MAKLLDMPKLSPTMEEGLLSAWHKKEGDTIAVDDVLADVETDKATMEFRSFDAGTLLKLLVPPGSTVRLGQPVAILGSAGEDISELLKQAGGGAAPAGAASPAAPEPKKEETAEKGEPAEVSPPKPAPAPAEASKAPVPPKASGNTAPAGAPPKHTGSILTRTEREGERPSGDATQVLASPFIRKMARDLGVDLSEASPTGPHGRLAPSDVEALKQRAGSGEKGLARVPGAGITTSGHAALAAPEVRPLSPMRKTIARRLTESKQNVPHFYLTIDVDAGELSALREHVNAELAADAPKSKEGAPDEKPLKVSLNDILIKACAVALVRVPECNATYTAEALLVHKRVDISVAVAVADGLVTPVIRNADQKSIVAIAKEVRELASRARQKKLRPEEMQEGTFSISNLGMFGIDSFSAVINPPEGAILAVGQVRDEPMVKDGAVVPGMKLSMTLSCDHRVIDGAVGAAFLAELRALIERPLRILTG
ncbi:MAG: dihydrolipoamide acetyltransferase family protein [Polyangiaceae bacterium]